MKKLLVSLMAVVVCAGMVGSSLAYFTDVETSTSNTFTAGTLDLEIRDHSQADPDPWGNGVDKTWVMSNMVPGVSWVADYIGLRNVGSIPENHVEISFSNTIDEETDPPGVNPVESDSNPTSVASDLAKWLQVMTMVFTDIDLKMVIEGTLGYDVNGNGWLDLDDLARSPAITAEGGPLDNLTPPRLTGGEASLHMTFKLNAGATNDIQGDVLTTVVTLVLNQVASQ